MDVADSREKVGKGLPRASFCNADDITACEEERHALGLDGERLFVLALLNEGEYLIAIATVIPVEDGVEYVLAPDFDVPCLLAVPKHFLRVVVLDLLSFSV